MSTDNTPVIIGVGFCQEKYEDPAASHEAWELMVLATRQAVKDAGLSADQTHEIESFNVLKGMWEYKNPGWLVASELGCPQARTTLADVGNLQLSALTHICSAIQEGRQELGVVLGGEAKYRDLRARITGTELVNRSQGDEIPPPDEYVGVPDPFATEAEAAAGIFMPVELFSVIESAIRANRGRTHEEHRDYLGNLYSAYSKIASKNPMAWSQELYSPNDIRDASDKNAMLAFPYTKRFNSQWNVNRAAAVVVSSVRKAKAMGLDANKWVYPVSAAQNRHVVCLAQKRCLYSQPGVVLAGKRAYDLAGIAAEDLSFAELYSCFPSAIQTFGSDLGISHIPWTISGSMAFAGGPYNHASIDGVVQMVQELRNYKSEKATNGIVSNLSGIFGKESVMILSTEPNKNGFCYDDITEEVSKIDSPLVVDANYSGCAKIVGYTVVYSKNIPQYAFLYCESPELVRTVIKFQDSKIITQMVQEEFVGASIEISKDKKIIFHDRVIS